MPVKTIGIIAGNGVFPITVAKAARAEGYRVVVVAHEGECLPEISETADQVEWIKVGQISRLIASFKENNVTDAVMAGGIKKTRLFGKVRPDFRGIALLAKIAVNKDDKMLRAFADELAGEGIQIRAATELLSSILAPEGLLTARRLSKAEEEDVEFAWAMAKEVGRLDIGQCVVVKEKTILAVEAIEGTDETIRRGGSLGREGAVVVKVSKPGQDLRFDLPAVGPGTISVMAEVGARVLAVEAGRTILLDRENLLDQADKAKISILGR
ncbi:MAG TPA: UDP-2,3-diacylglucosamine diphosphatase LpxI [Nitrospiria bacterium]